jgi:hypothetical protein
MATRGMRGKRIGSREFKGQVGRVQVGGASTPGVGFVVSKLGLACFGARACHFILDVHEPSHFRLASNTRGRMLLVSHVGRHG